MYWVGMKNRNQGKKKMEKILFNFNGKKYHITYTKEENDEGNFVYTGNVTGPIKDEFVIEQIQKISFNGDKWFFIKPPLNEELQNPINEAIKEYENQDKLDLGED
jgi:hypothetical protein